MKRLLLILLSTIITISLVGCDSTELNMELSVYHVSMFEETEFYIGDDLFEPSSEDEVSPRFNIEQSLFQIRNIEDFQEHSKLNVEEIQDLYPDGFFDTHSLIVIPLVSDFVPDITLEEYQVNEDQLYLRFLRNQWIYRTMNFTGPYDYYIVLELDDTREFDISYDIYDTTPYTHENKIIGMYHQESTYSIITSYEMYQEKFPTSTNYTEETFQKYDLFLYEAGLSDPAGYRQLLDFYITEYYSDWDLEDQSYDLGHILIVSFVTQRRPIISPMAGVHAHDYILVPKGTFDTIDKVTISNFFSGVANRVEYDYPIK